MSTPLSKPKRSHDIKVLAKAFEILEALNRSDGRGVRLSELAARLKLPKPTVFRILRSLEKLGYVVFDTSPETYRIAQRLKDLGQSHLSEIVGRLGRPAMMRLLAEFEQTVNLAVFENDKLIYKDMLEGLRSVRMHQVSGTLLSVTHSALGRSILAFLPRDRVVSIVDGQLLSGVARASVARIGSLLRELKKIRSLGYAVDNQHVEKGLCCVGAPIFDKHGQPVASISISGSSSILTPAVIRRIGKRVREACDEISMSLGYSNA